VVQTGPGVVQLRFLLLRYNINIHSLPITICH
jgi:hypothetical protein